MAWPAFILLLTMSPAAFADGKASGQALSPSQSARDAEALRARLEQVDAELTRKREAMALESMVLNPFSTRPAETVAAARGIGGAYTRSVRPLALEAAVIADRLRIFRETGLLPRSARRFDPSLFELDLDERTLDLSPHPIPGLPLPPLGLAALRRQLAPFHAVLFPDSRREVLAAVAPLPRVPRGEARPQGRFERDRGTGRTEVDPVPGLIAQLRAPRAVERALAADELGKRGEAAAPALSALRRALVDEDRRVRASAVLALSGVGRLPPDAQADIRRALLDPDEEVRFSARAALRRLSTP